MICPWRDVVIPLAAESDCRYLWGHERNGKMGKITDSLYDIYVTQGISCGKAYTEIYDQLTKMFGEV